MRLLWTSVTLHFECSNGNPATPGSLPRYSKINLITYLYPKTRKKFRFRSITKFIKSESETVNE